MNFDSEVKEVLARLVPLMNRPNRQLLLYKHEFTILMETVLKSEELRAENERLRAAIRVEHGESISHPECPLCAALEPSNE